MNLRKFLWTVLLASLAMMLLTLWAHRQTARQGTTAPSRPAGTTLPAGAGGAASAPAAGSAPAVRPPIAPVPPPATGPTSPPAGTPAVGPATAATTSAATQQRRWRNDTFEVHEAILGSLDKSQGYWLQVQLTSLGAAVRTVKLTDYFATVADKKRYHRDPATYEQALRQDKNLKGHLSLMNPVGLDPAGTIYPMATGRVTLPAENISLDLSGPRWRRSAVETDKEGTQRVAFTSDIFRDGSPYLRLEKTYTLRKQSYSVGVALRAVNLSDEQADLKVMQLGPTGVPREDIQADRRILAYGHYVSGDLKVAKPSISEAAKMQPGLGSSKPIGRSDGANPVVWLGVADKFFSALLYILPKESQNLSAPQAKAEFFQAAQPESPQSQTFLTGMNLGAYELPAGGDVTVDMDLFAGPKKRYLLDNTPLYRDLHYKETLDFGSCCTWAPLTLGMMWLLDVFHEFTFRNYGLAIILLVLLVRLALHPLTKRSQVSMSRMQKLQPEITRIREKYKDDKAKLNEEMMKVYKQQGATPILGCLPMALQMPIWVALWTGLSAAVELRQAPFLPFWITDLAAPDALISWGNPMTATSWPMVGPLVSLNLLPILLTIAMFIQQKMTPVSPTADQQARTQRQMMYFMSGFFMLMFYNAPSGLTLYIMASTFAGVAEQMVIRKHIQKKEAAEAAAETRVEMPGGRFRGQKPKKPKGPFRFFR